MALQLQAVSEGMMNDEWAARTGGGRARNGRG